jgi:hypothetical protein
MHPQTGEELNRFGCVDDHTITLQLDQTRRITGIQAAVESMRNELCKLQAEAMFREEQRHAENLRFASRINGVSLESPDTRKLLEVDNEAVG